MTLRSGRYTVGPADGSVLVRTGREGAARRIGHDLTLLATRWSATVTVDVEAPARSRVRATIDAGSLVVLESRGGAIGLTDAQKSEIAAITRETVLRSARHPRIAFRSTAVHRDGPRATVTGDLTIGRCTRSVVLALRVAARSRRVTAATAVVQTEFGITPYSALLGALRVKDRVQVVVAVRLPEGEPVRRARVAARARGRPEG